MKKFVFFRKNFQFFFHLTLISALFFLDSCSSLQPATRTNAQGEPMVLEEEISEVDELPEDLGEVSGEVSEEERKADRDSVRTFPLVYNDSVQQWINYFTGRGRPHYQRYMERSTRYIGLMKQILKEEGLPEDLIYLAMIESGFNNIATSRVGAKGPWQFMPFTGKRFGLQQDFWIDERRDFVKATHAAAKYLKELHAIFDSWYLAAAAYNAGEGRVLGAIREHRTRNFWELQRTKTAFRPETRNYVPKMIAAAMIGKNPEKYGFHTVNYEAPLAWEIVEIPGRVGFRSIAKVSGASEEELKALNPELRLGITPSDQSTYSVRIPPQRKEALLAGINQLEKGEISSFAYHNVRRGETLSQIARSYGSSVDAILAMNSLKSPRSLRVGQRLSVPVRIPAEGRSRQAKRSDRTNSPRISSQNSPSAQPSIRESSAGNAEGSHVVRTGESLWSISRQYGISVNELKSLNGLRNNNLRPGMTLKVSKNESRPATNGSSHNGARNYRVKPGDTLSEISKKFSVSVNDLRMQNKLKDKHNVPAGKVLRIR